jgi:hypothetical protein
MVLGSAPAVGNAVNLSYFPASCPRRSPDASHALASHDPILRGLPGRRRDDAIRLDAMAATFTDDVTEGVGSDGGPRSVVVALEVLRPRQRLQTCHM